MGVMGVILAIRPKVASFSHCVMVDMGMHIHSYWNDGEVIKAGGITPFVRVSSQ